MKKLLVILTIALSAIVANAASWKWTAANIYDPTDSATKLTGGTATLYAYLSSADASTAVSLTTTSVASGSISVTFENSTSTGAGNDYSFYFILESGDYTYTSATIGPKAAQATDTTTVGFGNLKTATTTGGGWQTAAVPEPTSGLLMLLGMAGLALRRRRV